MVALFVSAVGTIACFVALVHSVPSISNPQRREFLRGTMLAFLFVNYMNLVGAALVLFWQ